MPSKNKTKATTSKRSMAARQVAEDVLVTIGQGKRPVMKHILEKRGYSKATARGNVKQVVESKSYKEVIDPFVKKLITERNRALNAMATKLPKAKYRDTVDAVDKITKNIQLLTGGKTDNSGIEISWE